MDGWMDGRMNGWMYMYIRQIDIVIYKLLLLSLPKQFFNIVSLTIRGHVITTNTTQMYMYVYTNHIDIQVHVLVCLYDVHMYMYLYVYTIYMYMCPRM